MELNEMEKKLLFQVEGDYQTKILNERKRLNFRHGYKNPRPHFCNRSTLIIHI